MAAPIHTGRNRSRVDSRVIPDRSPWGAKAVGSCEMFISFAPVQFLGLGTTTTGQGLSWRAVTSTSASS